MMTKKKILFDLEACQPLGGSKFHGGGIYGYVVFSRLAETSPDKVIAIYRFSDYLDSGLRTLISEAGIECYDSAAVSIEDLCKMGIVSYVYTPLYNREKYDHLLDAGVRVFVTVHGLRALEMPRDKNEALYETSRSGRIKCLLKQTPYIHRLYSGYRARYSQVVNSVNSTIITVSEHSKHSLVFNYGCDESKLKVFYSPSTDDGNSSTVTPYSQEKYYLLVSANRWLKNAARAVMAFDDLFDKRLIDGRVILLGANKAYPYLRKIRNKDRFVLKGYVEKDELESLYAGAYCFIYPSLNEGFGYPPIEAMKYGTPVISSSFASISEVCGDAVLYVNPYSVMEIATRVLQMEDLSLRNELKVRSIARYKEIKARQDEDLDRLIEMLLTNITE